jgi:hypothetical protein
MYSTLYRIHVERVLKLGNRNIFFKAQVQLNCGVYCRQTKRRASFAIATACRLSLYLTNSFTCTEPNNIERFIEGQAFLRSYDSGRRPPPSPLSQSVSKRKRGGKGGGAWSQIHRSQESLSLYKSFNPICTEHITGPRVADTGSSS